MTPAAVVVGLGTADRGDDGLGPAVARRVAALGLPGVRVVEHEDPSGLIDVWAGCPLVVVVDAVRSGRPPGTIHRLETTPASPPLARSAPASAGRGGTHAFGVAEMVELARVLHHLPDRLVVIGVEAAAFVPGAPLSPPVAGAVDAAVGLVTAVVAGGAVPN
jgi:hydrogenase maturation protease